MSFNHIRIGVGVADNLFEQAPSNIKSMLDESSGNITAAIQASSQNLQSQLSGMKGQLNTIQAFSQAGNYIDPSNLPFNVAAIDNVAGQNVVTVRYQHLLTPVSVGDSLAGWTLTTADYSSQTAVFKNSTGEFVKADAAELTNNGGN